MDEVVWGRMPSERSQGFCRLRGSSLNWNVRVGNIIKVVFITVITAIVSLLILLPVVKYTSRSAVPIPHPKISNTSVEVKNCWSNVLSFGHDCTENRTEPPTTDFNKVDSDNSMQTKNELDKAGQKLDHTQNSTLGKELSSVSLASTQPKNLTGSRAGRSKWPYILTTSPYVNLAKPTPTTVPQHETGTRQTNIFAIPMDMSSDELSKPETKPHPYEFTPLTSFSNNYAQLLPYKHPTNYSNLERIWKYLRENKESVVHHNADNRDITIQNKNGMLKVTGTYVMPLDRRRPGEILMSKPGKIQNNNQPFNGHAYDPFMKFRPENLSEINKLVPVKTEIDVGPRFRKPMSFVPETSLDVDLVHPRLTGRHEPHAPGSHTVAIFHPPDFQPALIKRPPLQYAQENPLSVTLDIYPVAMDAEQDTWSVPSTLPNWDHGRPNPKLKPRPSNDRLRLRPYSPASTSGNPQMGRSPFFPSSNNHMIVHLNLYPRMRKPYTTISRELERNATSFLDSAKLLLSGGQFEERDSLVADNLESSKRKITAGSETTIPFLSSKSEVKSNKPEFSALKNLQYGVKLNTTTSNITTENISLKREHIDTSAISSGLLDQPSNATNKSSSSTTKKWMFSTIPKDSTVKPDQFFTYLEDTEVTPEYFPNNLGEPTTTEDYYNGLDDTTDIPEDLSSYVKDETVTSDNSYNILVDSTISPDYEYKRLDEPTIVTEDMNSYTNETSTQLYSKTNNQSKHIA